MSEFSTKTEAIEKGKEMKKSTDNNIVVIERNGKFVPIEAKPGMVISDKIVHVIEKGD